MVDLWVEGLPGPIGATATHPFWSLDRNGWVSAGELRTGETLGTLVSLVGKNRHATDLVHAVYEERYWDRVNAISVRAGAGTSTTVLVKDKTGNWHLKALDVDPVDLIRSAQVTAETMLEVAAKASVP